MTQMTDTPIPKAGSSESTNLVHEAITQTTVSNINRERDTPGVCSSNAVSGGKRNRQSITGEIPLKRTRLEEDQYKPSHWLETVLESSHPILSIPESSDPDQLHIDEVATISPPNPRLTIDTHEDKDYAQILGLDALSLAETPTELVPLLSIEAELDASFQLFSITVEEGEVDEGADTEAQEALVSVNHQDDDDSYAIHEMTKEPTPLAQSATLSTPAPPSLQLFSFRSEYTTSFGKLEYSAPVSPSLPSYALPSFSIFREFSSLPLPPSPQDKPALPGPPFPLPCALLEEKENSRPSPEQITRLPTFRELLASINSLLNPDLTAQTSSSISPFPDRSRPDRSAENINGEDDAKVGNGSQSN
ncbi:hypothetical protein F5Y12DRAFT_790968 [Xylaria sp. FL1777]|nr:hypothetical protein F5Y12DRAFT_790968 [Xylaria sp. FL1777]